MAYRLGQDRGYTRMGDLAEALMQPPSAAKCTKARRAGLFNYEKYGVVEFTDLGRETGEYLLRRHETIENSLKQLGEAKYLKDAEQIEHNISDETYKSCYCCCSSWNRMDG